MKIRLFILYLSTCLFFLQITAVKADYVDPSVMTYAIQSIAGLLIGLGTFFGVYWRKIAGSFQDTSLKEMSLIRFRFRIRAVKHVPSHLRTKG